MITTVTVNSISVITSVITKCHHQYITTCDHIVSDKLMKLHCLQILKLFLTKNRYVGSYQLLIFETLFYKIPKDLERVREQLIHTVIYI